jgi:hypothetical protein
MNGFSAAAAEGRGKIKEKEEREREREREREICSSLLSLKSHFSTSTKWISK